MSAEVIQANYEQLDALAARFARQAEVQQQVLARVRQDASRLQGGSWEGKGVAAFSRELDNQVLPAMQRLVAALREGQRVTVDIKNVVAAAEEQASRLFQLAGVQSGSHSRAGAAALDAAAAAMLKSAIPPRIYAVNGINNDGKEGADALRQYLIAHGYPADQIPKLPAVYDTNLVKYIDGLNLPNFKGTQLQGTNFQNVFLKPVNWLTGAGAVVANSTTSLGAVGLNGAVAFTRGSAIFGNTVLGAGQVLTEYVTGGSSQTARIERAILEDLRRNPLRPGEEVVLVGHSGGGAIVSNLAPRLEGLPVMRSDGTLSSVDVRGIVTLASPVVDNAGASRVGKVVEIHDGFDPIGQPWIRSDKLQTFLGGNGNSNYTIFSPFFGIEAHNKSHITGDQAADILNRELGLQLDTGRL